MRLADDIKVTFDHDTIYLRASLRAAFRLERRHGGFDKIIHAISDGNLSIMADVVRESSDTDLLNCIGALPMRDAIERLTEPLSAHILALAGVDDETNNSPADGQRSTHRIPFSEYFPKLFRLATGWCGMSPNDAWLATPAEIAEAYKGRLELLGACFGGGSDGDDKTAISKPDENTRRHLNAIGDLNVTSLSQVPSCQ